MIKKLKKICLILLICIFLVIIKFFIAPSPEPIVCSFIPDGFGAKVFSNYPYETEMFNDGINGYQKVVKIINEKPNRRKLAENLNCLSAFYAGYKLIYCYEKCDEIRNILNDLLKSDNLDDVQAAVTEIYYDFDIHSNNKTEHLVDSLENLRKNSKDEYTVRFAILCLNKMYSPRPITKEKYPVPSSWKESKKNVEE